MVQSQSCLWESISPSNQPTLRQCERLCSSSHHHELAVFHHMCETLSTARVRPLVTSYNTPVGVAVITLAEVTVLLLGDLADFFPRSKLYDRPLGQYTLTYVCELTTIGQTISADWSVTGWWTFLLWIRLVRQVVQTCSTDQDLCNIVDIPNGFSVRFLCL
jgi:hypothetical protein